MEWGSVAKNTRVKIETNADICVVGLFTCKWILQQLFVLLCSTVCLDLLSRC
jgi:hypothetical protein